MSPQWHGCWFHIFFSLCQTLIDDCNLNSLQQLLQWFVEGLFTTTTIATKYMYVSSDSSFDSELLNYKNRIPWSATWWLPYMHIKSRNTSINSHKKNHHIKYIYISFRLISLPVSLNDDEFHFEASQKKCLKDSLQNSKHQTDNYKHQANRKDFINNSSSYHHENIKKNKYFNRFFFAKTNILFFTSIQPFSKWVGYLVLPDAN